MSIVIIIFGALMLIAGIIIIIDPDLIFGFLKKQSDKIYLHITAVIVRLALGATFILEAGASKYPFAIEVIGWIFVTAAIILSVIGRNAFKRMISWALSLAKPVGRLSGILAICFGTFLVHAFV